MTMRSMIEAIRITLEDEMARDERVMVLGEDVGTQGGVFRATEGLKARFGGKLDFADKFADVSHIFEKTECAILSRALKAGGAALACRVIGNAVPPLLMQTIGDNW
jgi:pyruvate dehydrogenase E1 component beta subunit